MSEFRQNLATKEWVIISPREERQPSDYRKKRPLLPSYDENCPFCPGNEKLTPEAIFRYPQSGNWKIRVIPDRQSPLQPDFAITDLSFGSITPGSASSCLAETVIETPEHDKSVALMQMGEVTAILDTYRERYKALAESSNVAIITIFHNHGSGAGISMAHPHSHIVASPVIPAKASYQMEQSLKYYQMNGQCLHCFMLEQERKIKNRMIIDTDRFAAFCPFAAGSPFETVIYPKRHMGSFASIDDEELEELGWVLQTMMLKLYNCLDDPDYSYAVKSAPIGHENAGHLHWQIEIIPRVANPHGFALGSGINVNEVAPEAAARYLREIGIDC